MFYTPKSPNLANTPFIVSTNELLESSSRRIMFCCALVYGFCFCTIGMLWPTMLSGTLWLITLVVTLGTGLSMRLIRQHVAVAQALWHSSVILAISLAFFLLDFQEVALLLALLPFVAALSAGWRAIVFEEVAIVMLLIWFFQLQIGQDIPPLATMIMVMAILSGLLGGILVYTFSTIAHWSLIGFEQANMHMRKAQEHRAELAQTVRALDQAYYRLERSNVALVAARKVAEEAERFKSEFVANVSHELRTPLNLIIGFSEVMMTSPESYGNEQLPRSYRSDLNAIYHSAQHLLDLVDDVLDLARIEAGKIRLTREETALWSLINEAAETVRDYITKKRLQFIIDVEPDLPNVQIDRVRIRQVLLNLLINAARFTQEGSIRLVAKLTGEEVLIEVIDTGLGIAPQDLPKVFEEFRSTEQPISSWHSGTGLGLPISKKFVELHNGKMGVESELKRGTRFWFTLPISRTSPKQLLSQAQQRWHPRIWLGNSKRLIVVVHEDERVAQMVQHMMDDFEVVGATDLEEGIRLVDELKALALVVDNEQKLPPIEADFLIFRCPLPSNQQAGLLLGAQDYLVKPVAYQDLLATIKRVQPQPERVLIVDDEPEVVRLFKRMLSSYLPPQRCLEAFTGSEALSMMREHRPNLVLLDLSMPDSNGTTVLEQKANIPEIADIPVIIVSSQTPDFATIRLGCSLSLERTVGLRQEEIVRVIEQVCHTLAPEWEQLESDE